jgi:hypothetical protein
MRKNRARDLRAQGLAVIQLAGLQKFLIAFMILALMSLPFVQPIQKKEEAKKEDTKSAGDLQVEVHWPDKLDIDVDVWVKCPLDERPVGYSNRAGATCNLLRDDLGKPNDATDRNFEMIYTRGMPAGEYIINLNYFESRESEATSAEVPVEVVVSKKAAGKEGDVGRMTQVIVRKAVLRIRKEEVTVVRFTIREDGELDKESINDLSQELLQWQPTMP